MGREYQIDLGTVWIPITAVPPPGDHSCSPDRNRRFKNYRPTGPRQHENTELANSNLPARVCPILLWRLPQASPRGLVMLNETTSRFGLV